VSEFTCTCDLRVGIKTRREGGGRRREGGEGGGREEGGRGREKVPLTLKRIQARQLNHEHRGV